MQPVPPRQRRLRLVRGYESGTYPPPRAYDAGLRERFAAVLDTYRPDAEGMLSDVELFLGLVDALLEAVPHDQVLFELGDTRQASAPRPIVTLEPPQQIILAWQGRVVGVIETECRVNIGGPEPFHDAYTVAVYTKVDRSADFRAACGAVCEAAGAVASCFAEGVALREPFVPFWKRPLRWVGRKAW